MYMCDVLPLISSNSIIIDYYYLLIVKYHRLCCYSFGMMCFYRYFVTAVPGDVLLVLCWECYYAYSTCGMLVTATAARGSSYQLMPHVGS